MTKGFQKGAKPSGWSSSFHVKVALGAFAVAACLVGVIETQLEIRMRRKAESLYRAEEGSDERLPDLPPARTLKFSPTMWGIFVFGNVTSILWSVFSWESEIGLALALLTAGSLAFMVTIRALNGQFSGQPVNPPDEPPDARPIPLSFLILVPSGIHFTNAICPQKWPLDIRPSTFIISFPVGFQPPVRQPRSLLQTPMRSATVVSVPFPAGYSADLVDSIDRQFFIQRGRRDRERFHE